MSRLIRLLALPATVLTVGAVATACTSTTDPRPSSSPSAASSGRITPGPSSPPASGSSSDAGSTLTPSSAVPVVELSKLDGSTVPTTFILDDDTKGVTEAKFYLANKGKTFLSSAKAAPFQVALSLDPGPNTVQVRHEIDGDRSRLSVSFTVKTGARRPGAPSAAPTAPTKAIPIPIPTPTVTVSTADQLAAALSSAGPGTSIHLEDGLYSNDRGRRWLLSKSGTALRPITLEGGRGAVLESDSPKGDYGLSITGSYWHVLGITVRNASKGIVLDGSQHTVLDDVEVANTGDEGVHFRTCSSNNVLQNSYVHDTGLDSPNFGEGVYVGSANSNWSKYGCLDGQDKSEHNVIRGNTFKHIAAEGADLKEGTDSGALIGNAFMDTGYSGENSADSAVDAKGNNWVISGNIVSDPSGADKDAFQTHSVYRGYGTANVFVANAVEGTWPGFGIAMYPQAANIVFCSNVAPDAEQGLVGGNGHALRCSR